MNLMFNILYKTAFPPFFQLLRHSTTVFVSYRLCDLSYYTVVKFIVQCVNGNIVSNKLW